MRRLRISSFVVEHHAVRAEDLAERGAELFFDPTSGLLELRTRNVERQLHATQLRRHFVWRDMPHGKAPFRRIAHQPGAPHPQPGRNARAGDLHCGHFRI